MPQLTATGNYAVITSGFVASGEIDQSEGRGGTREIGSFSEVEEAISAAAGKGTQGDSGYVHYFEWRLFDGGLLQRHSTPVWIRRQEPGGYYRVGWAPGWGN